MRATKSWIAEYADLPAGLSAWQLADALVSAGLEVEQVEAAAGAGAGRCRRGRGFRRAVDGKAPQPRGKIAALLGIGDMAGGGTDAVHVRRLAGGVGRE